MHSPKMIYFLVLVTTVIVILTAPGISSSVVYKCEVFNNTCSKNSVGSPGDGSSRTVTTSVLSFERKTASKQCKIRKSYWKCQDESGEDDLVVEFEEEYPDWTKDYWTWRSKYIHQITLKIDFNTEESVLLTLSAPGNISANPQFQKFKTKFLDDLEKEFCFQKFKGKGGQINLTRDTSKEKPLSCSYTKSKKKESIGDVYIGLLFIASVFLLLTCIVHLIIWDYQTLHGWTIFSEVFSNFFMILTVGLSHYYVRDLDIGPASPGCITLAITSHFFFLSTFHWMTVINYNLWKTFRQLRDPASRNSNKIVTYTFYTAFAIGVPLIVVMLSFLVEYLHNQYSDEAEKSNVMVTTLKKMFMKPNYGKKFCYMSKEAQGHYIYYPIGTLIVTNAVLFGLTAFSLLKHRKETKILEGNRNVSTRKNGRCDNCTRPPGAGPTQSVFVFAKLFSIMGVSWVFEVFAWAFSKPGENIPLYWIIFDITNLIQAIAVFIIFVLKKDVLMNVKKKLSSSLIRLPTF